MAVEEGRGNGSGVGVVTPTGAGGRTVVIASRYGGATSSTLCRLGEWP